nr:C4-dicarboxylate TRAP transporter substrate-binding protein [Arthrobacter zhangbolii]
MKTILSTFRARREPTGLPVRSGPGVLKGIAAVTGTLVLLSGCALNPRAEDYSADAPLELRYADYAPATASGPLNEFAATLTAETQGRLTVEPYWGGSLLGSKDLPSGLRAGIADIGIFSATQHASEYPVTNWMSSTASIGSKDFPEGVLQTYAGFADFAYNSEEINKQFEDLGLKMLVPLHTILKYDLICTSPVETLADAKGKRVRSGGPLWDGEIKAAGMIPVTLPVDETYEGLQRGVVDCAIASPRTAMTYGFWETAKYYTEVPFTGINSQYIVMNQSSWDALSAEDQDILWEAGHTWWFENLFQDAIQEYNRFFEVAGAEHGVAMMEADPGLTGAITAYQQRVIDGLPQNAPPTVEQPGEIVDEYIQTSDHWLEMVKSMDLGNDPKNLDLSGYREITKTNIWDKVEHEPSR